MTPDSIAYHELVGAECRGEAPEGTAEILAQDPFRWAAHLGMIIGDITEQIVARRGDPSSADWVRSAVGARHAFVARKGDVVAIRKRTALADQTHRSTVRAHGLLDALRAVQAVLDDEAIQDEDALDRIADLVEAALVRPADLRAAS